MTTLAIIGGGIAGRSLLYTLAKEQKEFEKITLFHSDSLTFPCSLHSTAVVSLRGLTPGHSPLGDLLIEGHKTFSEHFLLDHPKGVKKAIQLTAATQKKDEFLKRYPSATNQKLFFKSPLLTATGEAHLIDPQTYGEWLVSEAKEILGDKLEVLDDFVSEIERKGRVHLKTNNGRSSAFDKVIVAGGNYNRFWTDLAPESKLKSSKPIQGTYLEFNKISMSGDSFSLTLDGGNIIWDKDLQRLLIGSTSLETNILLPPIESLTKVYEKLSSLVELELPPMNAGEIKVGLREKAQKRQAYLFEEDHLIFWGGLYKNGYSLALKMARDLSRQFL